MSDLVRVVNSNNTLLVGFMQLSVAEKTFGPLKPMPTPSWFNYEGKRKGDAPTTDPDASIPTYSASKQWSKEQRRECMDASRRQAGMSKEALAEVSHPHYSRVTPPSDTKRKRKQRSKADTSKPATKSLIKGDGRSGPVRIIKGNPTASHKTTKKRINQIRNGAHSKQRSATSLVVAEAKMQLMDDECDRKTINAVVDRIKDAFTNDDPSLIAGPLGRELERKPSLRLHILRSGNSTVNELAERVLDGDMQIVGDIAWVMASAYLNDTFNEPEVDGPAGEGDDSNLPEWAKEQRSFVERWADEVLCEDKASGVALALARSIAKRKMCILSFDGLLYREVSEADLFGESTGSLESFPFLISIITLHGFSDVYGVAVFDKDALAKIDPSWKQPKGDSRYGVAYISNKAGIVSNPPRAARSVAERLITYLDCDNAIVETVYMDAESSGRVTRLSASESTVEMPIIHGSDVVTGTRIVRVQKEPSSGRLAGGRKAHFRRGYYRRQRIGSRDDWHYEKRWVKPTFVHGSNAAIVERKVTRIVL